MAARSFAAIFEMDDVTAYMALALNNAQGELSPLEVGLHALHSGLSQTEYGKQMGLSQDSISLRMRAAKVADTTRVVNGDLWRHLAEIKSAPEWLWRTSVFNGPLKAATSDDASFPRYEFHSQRFAILAKHIV
jgi:hypothetical protein